MGMRVLVATGLYPPEGGGPAKHTVMMETELPKHGIAVSVVPFRRVRHLPRGVRHVMYVWFLMKEAFNADIIFAQDTVSVGVPAAIAALITRRKLVVRVPGDHAWEQARQKHGISDTLEEFQHKRYGVRVEVTRALARWSVRAAHLVIVPSEYMGAIVDGWLPPGKKAKVVYNGISLPVVTQSPTTRPAGAFIASLGRLVPWKGMLGVVDLVRDEPQWHAVIIGGGPESGVLRTRVADYELRDRVVLTGELSNAEALGWVATADVFVLNSSYEGLSHVLIEVMSLGVPIVATDIPGNRELIRDGVHGRLVPVGDARALHAAVHELMTDRERAHSMGERAVERAHMFDIVHTGAQLAAALKTL